MEISKETKRALLANIVDYMVSGVSYQGLEDILGESYEALGFSQLLTIGQNNASLNQAIKYATLAFASYHPVKLEDKDWADKIFCNNISPEQTRTMLNIISTHEESLQENLFDLLMNTLPRSKPLFYRHTNVHYGPVTMPVTMNDTSYEYEILNDNQMMLAVLSDYQGMPFAYEIVPEGKGGVMSLIIMVEEIVKKHPVKNLRIVLNEEIFYGFSEEDHELIQKEADKLGVKLKCVIRRPEPFWALEEFFCIHSHFSKEMVSAQVFLYFLAHCTLKHTELYLKECNLRLNPRNLRRILSEVKVMVYEHTTHSLAEAICVPFQLSSMAQKIYSIYCIEAPMAPYLATIDRHT